MNQLLEYALYTAGIYLLGCILFIGLLHVSPKFRKEMRLIRWVRYMDIRENLAASVLLWPYIFFIAIITTALTLPLGLVLLFIPNEK